MTNMPYLEKIIRVAVDNGLGIASFVALMVFVIAALAFFYQMWKFVDKFMSNHMAHIEHGVTEMAEHLGEMNGHMRNISDDQKEIRQGINKMNER